MGNTVGSKKSKAHVSRIFEKMNTNMDGKVTLEEFITYCTTQRDTRQSLMVWLNLIKFDCRQVKHRNILQMWCDFSETDSSNGWNRIL